MPNQRPAVLHPGSRVAVTCPSSPVHPAALERGVERLRALGWEVIVGESCRKAGGLWAGSDEERAGELASFLRDRSVAAIFAARGGVGALRALPHLSILREDLPPRWLVGHSDITALHLYLWGRFGWVGLSGPMIAVNLGAADDPPEPVVRETLHLLGSTEPAGVVPGERMESWIEGEATGPLVPANLSLLVSMVGTGFLPSLRGAILVLEDVEEPPQRIDRMLTQLRLSGAIAGIAALSFGQFTRCEPRDPDLPAAVLRDVLFDHAKRIGVPTIAGVDYGHEPVFHPLPVGTQARLVAGDPPSLELIEPAGSPRTETSGT